MVTEIIGESKFLGTEIFIESHNTLFSLLSDEFYWAARRFIEFYDGIFLSSFGVYWLSLKSCSPSSSAMIVWVNDSRGIDIGIESIMLVLSSSKCLYRWSGFASIIIRFDLRNWACWEEEFCFEMSTAVVFDAKLCLSGLRYFGQSNGLSSFMI